LVAVVIPRTQILVATIPSLPLLLFERPLLLSLLAMLAVILPSDPASQGAANRS
jgi:hypothetical protein